MCMYQTVISILRAAFHTLRTFWKDDHCFPFQSNIKTNPTVDPRYLYRCIRIPNSFVFKVQIQSGIQSEIMWFIYNFQAVSPKVLEHWDLQAHYHENEWKSPLFSQWQTENQHTIHYLCPTNNTSYNTGDAEMGNDMTRMYRMVRQLQILGLRKSLIRYIIFSHNAIWCSIQHTW